ncbi:hypothetical protein ABIB94_001075 [Bradyrhizobium sp. JR7.2]
MGRSSWRGKSENSGAPNARLPILEPTKSAKTFRTQGLSTCFLTETYYTH